MRTFFWGAIILFLSTNCFGEPIYGQVFFVEKPDKIQIFAADIVTDIYLAGIENPSSNSPNREMARKLLADLVYNKKVKCEKAYVDNKMKSHYFVSLADGTVVNEKLISSGLVWPESEEALQEFGYDTDSDNYRSFTSSLNKVKANRLGLWSTEIAVSPSQEQRSIDLKKEYLRKVKHVKLNFDNDTKWPLKIFLQSGKKIIASDGDITRLMDFKDIGTVVYSGVEDVSLLVISDTFKVPVKETSDEFVWSNSYKGSLGFKNDSRLCNLYSSLEPEGIVGYNFYDCMTNMGWWLKPVKVEHFMGEAELIESN